MINRYISLQGRKCVSEERQEFPNRENNVSRTGGGQDDDDKPRIIY